MATLKERLHRKNAQGTYDVVHLETASSLVLRPGGRTVEQDLTDYLPEIQATESLPKTLKGGKLLVCKDRVYIGSSDNVPMEVVTMAHQLEISTIGNIAKLGGMTMEEILDRQAMQNSMSNGENASKYGYMVKFVDANDEPLVNFPVYRVNNGTVDSSLAGYTNKSGTLTLMLENTMDAYFWCADEANHKYAYGRVISGMGQIASETLKADKKFELKFTTAAGAAIANTAVYKDFGNNTAAFNTDANGYVKLADFLQAAGNKVSSSLTLTIFHSGTTKYGKAAVSLNLENGLTKTVTANSVLGAAMGITAAGGTVKFNGETWRVAHVANNIAYLAREDLVSETQFGSNTTYAGSTLASVAKTYENNLPAQWKNGLNNTTVNGVTAKVFAPSKEQMDGGWSYFNSNANRICKLNGTAKNYWTSSPSSSSYVWAVTTSGAPDYYDPSYTFGFRPCVAVPLA